MKFNKFCVFKHYKSVKETQSLNTPYLSRYQYLPDTQASKDVNTCLDEARFGGNMPEALKATNVGAQRQQHVCCTSTFSVLYPRYIADLLGQG